MPTFNPPPACTQAGLLHLMLANGLPGPISQTHDAGCPIQHFPSLTCRLRAICNLDQKFSQGHTEALREPDEMIKRKRTFLRLHKTYISLGDPKHPRNFSLATTALEHISQHVCGEPDRCNSSSFFHGFPDKRRNSARLNSVSSS